MLSLVYNQMAHCTKSSLNGSVPKLPCAESPLDRRVHQALLGCFSGFRGSVMNSCWSLGGARSLWDLLQRAWDLFSGFSSATECLKTESSHQRQRERGEVAIKLEYYTAKKKKKSQRLLDTGLGERLVILYFCSLDGDNFGFANTKPTFVVKSQRGRLRNAFGLLSEDPSRAGVNWCGGLGT